MVGNVFLYRNRSSDIWVKQLGHCLDKWRGWVGWLVGAGEDKCWSDSAAGICAVPPLCIMYNVIIGRHPATLHCPLTNTIHSTCRHAHNLNINVFKHSWIS